MRFNVSQTLRINKHLVNPFPADIVSRRFKTGYHRHALNFFPCSVPVAQNDADILHIVRRAKPLENLRRVLLIGDKNHRRLSTVLSKSAHHRFPRQTDAVSENKMENRGKI